jgi:hypothetical protein
MKKVIFFKEVERNEFIREKNEMGGELEMKGSMLA